MRKIACFILIYCYTVSLAFAQSAQEVRRLEEEKRDSLTHTEVHFPSVAQGALPKDPSAELIFLKTLYARPVARVSDAARVVKILTGGGGGPDVGDADGLLRKGEAALMFCRALDIRGGLALRLFPGSERYALRELVYIGIVAAEGPLEVVTGPELVAMFIQAVDHMGKRGGRLP